MSAGHDHTGGANEKALKRALFLTSTFRVVVVVGAIVLAAGREMTRPTVISDLGYPYPFLDRLERPPRC